MARSSKGYTQDYIEAVNSIGSPLFSNKLLGLINSTVKVIYNVEFEPLFTSEDLVNRLYENVWNRIKGDPSRAAAILLPVELRRIAKSLAYQGAKYKVPVHSVRLDEWDRGDTDELAIPETQGESLLELLYVEIDTLRKCHEPNNE